MLGSLEEQLRSRQLSNGWTHPLMIAEMINGWQAFIEQCEDAYEWNIYEYENDISIRDRIALILDDADMSTHTAVQHMSEQVTLLDQRFRSLLQEGVSIKGTTQPWWRRGVLIYASSEYVKDIRNLYSIDVEIR